MEADWYWISKADFITNLFFINFPESIIFSEGFEEVYGALLFDLLFDYLQN